MAESTHRNTQTGISGFTGDTEAICPSAPTHRCLSFANRAVPSKAVSEQNRNCAFHMRSLLCFSLPKCLPNPFQDQEQGDANTGRGVVGGETSGTLCFVKTTTKKPP